MGVRFGLAAALLGSVPSMLMAAAPTAVFLASDSVDMIDSTGIYVAEGSLNGAPIYHRSEGKVERVLFQSSSGRWSVARSKEDAKSSKKVRWSKVGGARDPCIPRTSNSDLFACDDSFKGYTVS